MSTVLVEQLDDFDDIADDFDDFDNKHLKISNRCSKLRTSNASWRISVTFYSELTI